MPYWWPTSSSRSPVPSAMDHGTQVVTRWTGSESAQNTFSRRSTDSSSAGRLRRGADGGGGGAVGGRAHPVDGQDLEPAGLALLGALDQERRQAGLAVLGRVPVAAQA